MRVALKAFLLINLILKLLYNNLKKNNNKNNFSRRKVKFFREMFLFFNIFFYI